MGGLYVSEVSFVQLIGLYERCNWGVHRCCIH